MDNLDGLLTSRQVTERAKIHRATLKRWVASGRLIPAAQVPGYKGAHLFRVEDVDRAAAPAGRAS